MIRTDRAALVTGGVLIGLYVMIAAHLFARSDGAAAWTFDHMAVVALAAGIVHAVLFAAGHQVLRRQGWRSRAAYVALGAACACMAFLAGVGLDPFREAAAEGTVILTVLRPAVAGMIAGFLYRRRAGFDREGDDPHALASAAVEEANGSGTAVTTTATAAYYDGPVQVRSSPVSALIAALFGAALHVLAVMTGLMADALPADAYPPTFSLPGRAAALGIVGLGIPYVLFVLAANRMLAAAGRTSRRAYAVVGGVTPLVFGLMLCVVGLGPLGFIMTGQFILPSIVAMLTYRSLAGLEPKDLPDDLEVRDPRTLVGADHVRRRSHRIIMDG